MNDGQSQARSFDIGQEKDLIALLREVRHSTLSPEEKDAVRDAVFEVAQSKNAILLRGLKETLATVGITLTLDPTPEHTSTEADPAPARKTTAITEATPSTPNTTDTSPVAARRAPEGVFGRTRQAVFLSNTFGSAVSVPGTDDMTPVKESVVSAESTDEPKKESAPETAPQTDVSPQVPPAPVSTVPDATQDTTSASPTPSAPVSAPEVFTEKSAVVPEALAEETDTNIAAASSAPMTSEAAMERIKLIKQKVNSAVGNPVNLISKNEAVGKEYMATLLEAMRVATADGDVASVMQKLEGVYKKVEAVLSGELGEQTAPAPTPNDVEAASVAPAVAEVAPETPAAEEPARETTPPPIEVTPTPAPKTPEVATMPTPSPAPTPDESLVEAQSPAEEVSDVDAVLAAADAALGQTAGAPTERTASTPDTSATSAAVAVVTPESTASDTTLSGNRISLKKINSSAFDTTPSQTNVFQSVTAEPSAIDKQRQVFEQYDQQQKKFAQDNPLMAPVVEEGLAQLLGEWELFKKSGLLGTGPKAKEHPLYKRLKDLKMNLVVSGRFEGATPEVRQSVIDYMNGWRYEHGLVHDMDETFEHYLRRVISTVLKKQGNA